MASIAEQSTELRMATFRLARRLRAHKADQAMSALQRMADKGKLDMENAAVVVRAADGTASYRSAHLWLSSLTLMTQTINTGASTLCTSYTPTPAVDACVIAGQSVLPSSASQNDRFAFSRARYAP